MNAFNKVLKQQTDSTSNKISSHLLARLISQFILIYEFYSVYAETKNEICD